MKSISVVQIRDGTIIVCLANWLFHCTELLMYYHVPSFLDGTKLLFDCWKIKHDLGKIMLYCRTRDLHRFNDKQLISTSYSCSISSAALRSSASLRRAFKRFLFCRFEYTNSSSTRVSSAFSWSGYEDKTVCKSLLITLLCSSYCKLFLHFSFLLFFKWNGRWTLGLVNLCWHWSNVTGRRPHLTIIQ